MDDAEGSTPEAANDPRTRWRRLPDPVLPDSAMQDTGAPSSSWDREPQFDPITGLMRNFD